MKICIGIIIWLIVGFIFDAIIFSEAFKSETILPMRFSFLVGPIAGGVIAAKLVRNSREKPTKQTTHSTLSDRITCSYFGGGNNSFAKYCAYCENKLCDNNPAT